VVIPAYNVGKFIARTLDSVLAQTRPADEIIVVDDGSTDETGEVVARYGQKIRYIRQENAGASTARNTGIKAAQNEWIAFLDGDDEWLPEKLQLQIELLQRNPQLFWTTGNFYRCLCDEDRRGTDITAARATRLMAGQDYLENYFPAYMIGLGGWTGTMIIKRDALHKVGLFRPQQKRANDLDMWWRIAHRWPRIGYLPQPLAIYHMGTPVSISQGFFPTELYCDLIARHQHLAAEQGHPDIFRNFAAWILRRWIRSMLFQARAEDVRSTISRFNELLPAWYKLWMRILTAFPGTTATGCHLISRMIQKFKLRKRIARRPKR